MSPFRPLSITARTITVAATSCALVAGASLVGITAADAATTTPSSAVPSTAAPTPHAAKTTLVLPFRSLRPAGLRHLVGKLPATLTADLKALRGKKGADRRQAVESIETRALAGGYGSDIEEIASRAKAVSKSEPAALKEDLKSLRGLDRTHRTAELAKIDAEALAGGYGSTIESYAKELQAAAAKHAAASAAPALGSML